MAYATDKVWITPKVLMTLERMQTRYKELCSQLSGVRDNTTRMNCICYKGMPLAFIVSMPCDEIVGLCGA